MPIIDSPRRRFARITLLSGCLARRVAPAALLTAAVLASGCVDEEVAAVLPVVLTTGQAKLTITLEPFSLTMIDSEGNTLLRTAAGEGAYAGATATVDTPYDLAKSLPGWDTYSPGEGTWVAATHAELRDRTPSSATIDVTGEGIDIVLTAEVDGDRIRIAFEARGNDAAGSPLNKTSLAFELPSDERFFGLGERFATLDHRGWSLYSYAEEGALGGGEDNPPSDTNPYPNGPSMTYFPVPFYLSSKGYGVHLTTTYRTETHFGSEQEGAYRVASNSPAISMTVYAQNSPLAIIDAYTEDTGRPTVPAPWVFGPRRRVNVNAMVDGVEELVRMRQDDIPITGVDDAVHFLPALSQLGNEDNLTKWTSRAHELGYKAMCYNNPYVAKDNENAAEDYAFGLENGYFVKKPDGTPALTQFVSGKLLTLATIDLSNPDAFTWFQSLLKRSLDIGYDGWMHDFGEYIPRDAVLFDGRRGDEFHNAFPVLSAKAAHDLMEKERPHNHLFFVRSGGSGTQAYVPAVWGGDAEASFDETQGLPSSVRGGLNLSMSGVPYWGSDMTGFKCLDKAPHDKEVFLRWVEFGAVSPIMMEQDACVNPVDPQQKWKLWNDQETIDVYRRYARLHTRLSPYFDVLALQAHATGQPLTMHPFLLHPDDPSAGAVEDAYYLGPGLYVSPVVRRGLVQKTTYLPAGRYVEWDTLDFAQGGQSVTTAAPLDTLPMWLVEGQIVPLLDATIDTLAPATDPEVVTPADVADRLDVRVALGPDQTATLVLADGTKLVAHRIIGNHGNPDALLEATAEEIDACDACYLDAPEGDVERLRVTTPAGSGPITVGNVRVESIGPARRIRWDVLRTP